MGMWWEHFGNIKKFKNLKRKMSFINHSQTIPKKKSKPSSAYISKVEDLYEHYTHQT
jgi:hypothetical protein